MSDFNEQYEKQVKAPWACLFGDNNFIRYAVAGKHPFIFSDEDGFYEQTVETAPLEFKGTFSRVELPQASATTFALSKWDTLIDRLVFDALLNNCNRILYGKDKYAHAHLCFSDCSDVDGLNRLQTFAKAMLAPVEIGGSYYYLALFHPYQLYSLMSDMSWHMAMDMARKLSAFDIRFKRAVAVYRDLIIWENASCPTGSGAGPGGDLDYADGFVLGRNSLCWLESGEFPIVSTGQEGGTATVHSSNNICITKSKNRVGNDLAVIKYETATELYLPQ